ncbi:MAG TPA: hypothetical protein VH500_05705 [Nitrososphaeraceae archaeon]|jgi:hypothetical protein
MRVGSVYQVYEKYKKEYFPKLLASPTVPPEDKDKIKDLLKKRWNPYIRQALNTWNILVN